MSCHRYCFLFTLILLTGLAACTGNQGSEGDGFGRDPGPAPGNSDARGFEILPGEESTILLVYDPWNRRDTFARYEFVNDSIRFHRWAVFSTTHIGFLDALGEADRVVGCTSPDRIYHSGLREKYHNKNLVRIGTDMEFNIESLHQLNPDILMQSAFPGQKSRDSRILESGIRLVYLMEWLEPTPLGRAEWIRVFGLLLNKMELADSLFVEIHDSYHSLLAERKAAKNIKQPRVLIGNSFKGTWYLPGGASYQASLIRDAGFDYPYFETGERGSLPMSFEVVMHQFKDAEVWINVAAPKLSHLKGEDERYSLFRAFAEEKVYAYNNRLRDEIANDYWESGVVNPHLILKDLMIISQPGIYPETELFYYRKLD